MKRSQRGNEKSTLFRLRIGDNCKIARVRLYGKRVRVYETGISYAGRTYKKGKKIGGRDAISPIIQIIRFRFMD
jgi:hypothetical protein